MCMEKGHDKKLLEKGSMQITVHNCDSRKLSVDDTMQQSCYTSLSDIIVLLYGRPFVTGER